MENNLRNFREAQLVFEANSSGYEITPLLSEHWTNPFFEAGVGEQREQWHSMPQNIGLQLATLKVS